jgi:hypothetical protein
MFNNQDKTIGHIIKEFKKNIPHYNFEEIYPDFLSTKFSDIKSLVKSLYQNTKVKIEEY